MFEFYSNAVTAIARRIGDLVWKVLSVYVFYSLSTVIKKNCLTTRLELDF